MPPNHPASLCRVGASLLCALLCSTAVQAEQPQDYAYVAPLQTAADAPLHRLTLPAEVLSKLTRSDLGDLRIFNAAGESLPHALETAVSPNVPATVTRHTAPIFPLGSATDSGRALHRRVETAADGAVQHVAPDAGRARGPASAWLIDASQINGRPAALELHMLAAASPVSGRLRVEASKDLSQWRTLVSSAALNPQADEDGQGSARVRVEWPATEAAYLRLSWSGSPPPGLRDHVFDSAWVETEAPPAELPRSWLQLEASAPHRATSPHELHFILPPALSADRLQILPPAVNGMLEIEIYTRPRADVQWRSLGRHPLWRLDEGGIERHNPPLALRPERELMLRATGSAGLGNPPPTLSIGWPTRALVFAAHGQPPFTLAFGRHGAQPVAQPLGTLLAPLQHGSPARDIAPAQLGEITPAGGPALLEAPPDRRGMLLWIALLIIIAVLATMAHRLSAQRRATKPDNPPTP